MLKYIWLIIVFLLSFTSRAEIPFSHALGVYTGTKDEYKDISPFWGMVALHTLLPNIRFFGHYETSLDSSDKPLDPIAELILNLFPSPDGIQFVANANIKDPVGDLSRNPDTINNIIQILRSLAGDDVKKDKIFELLNKITPQKPNKTPEVKKKDFVDLF